MNVIARLARIKKSERSRETVDYRSKANSLFASLCFALTLPVAAAHACQPGKEGDYPHLAFLKGAAVVEMSVNGETITIAVDGDHAPITGGNFVDLMERGVYDGTVFHRVVREPNPFVVQGGDPQSRDPNVPPQRLGTGSFVDPETSQARYIPLEIKPEGASEAVCGGTLKQAGVAASPQLKHTRGAVAMARSQQPDSASSQFYFALADLGFLNGSYAVFGYVTEGMDAVDQIQQGDKIDWTRIISGAENLQKPAN